MSHGGGGRGGRSGHGRSGKGSKGQSHSRSSRSGVRMTSDRAHAIQSHADRTGRNQDFKSRAMSAAVKNEEDSS